MSYPTLLPAYADQFEEASIEAWRARNKFGDQEHLTDLEWLAVLAEEFGEAAMHVTKTSVRPVTDDLPAAELVKELRQVAAVAVRWIAVIEGRSPALEGGEG